MKIKLFATVLALCLTLSIPSIAAEESNPNPNYIESSVEELIIPVTGYLGPDSHVIVPEPKTEIYVEVPVEIFFAAFESGAGIVTSPKYTISNLSDTSDLKIEIENFSQKNESNASLNGQLTLKLITHENEDLLTGIFPSDYQSKKLLCARLPKAIEGLDDNKLGFMIGGTWGGGFDEEIRLEFDITLKFSIVE